MGKVLEVEKTYKLTLQGHQLQLLHECLRQKYNAGQIRGTCLNSVYTALREELDPSYPSSEFDLQ